MASDEPRVLDVDPLRNMHPDDSRFERLLKDTFMRTPTGLPDMGKDWVGAKLLGKGGQGQAGLWVKVDTQTQKVVERIVIKESYLKERQWKDLDNWFIPYSVPMEAHINGLLTHEPTNVVKIEHVAVFPEKRAIRQYIEFCQLGDLWHNLQWHQTRERRKLPEAYLWCVLEQLLRAAVTLEHPVKPPGPPGQWVVHMDLKADNVFLSLPDPNHFPRYPVAKVGDFGAAMLCRPHENQHSKFEYIVYSPGYLPPEIWWRHKRRSYPIISQIVAERDRPELMRPVTGAANIWTIGMIMTCLLNGHSSPDLIDFAQNERSNWIPALDAAYSYDIRKYISACMHQDARLRPNAEYLLSRLPRKQQQFAQPMMDQRCMQEDYDGSQDLVNQFKDRLFPPGAQTPYKTPAILAEEARNPPQPAPPPPPTRPPPAPPQPEMNYSFVPGAPDHLGAANAPHLAAGTPFSFVPGKPDNLIPRKPVPAPAPAPEEPSLPHVGSMHLGTGVRSVGGAVAEAVDEPMMDAPAAEPETLAAEEDPIAEAMAAAAEQEAQRAKSSEEFAYLKAYWDQNPE